LVLAGVAAVLVLLVVVLDLAVEVELDLAREVELDLTGEVVGRTVACPWVVVATLVGEAVTVPFPDEVEVAVVEEATALEEDDTSLGTQLPLVALFTLLTLLIALLSERWACWPAAAERRFREFKAPWEIGLLPDDEERSIGGARKGLYASGEGRANTAGRRVRRASTFILVQSGGFEVEVEGYRLAIEQMGD